MKKMSNGKIVVPKIFALDPTRDGFMTVPHEGFEPLSKDDAEYVQVIHTNGGTLGVLLQSGTVDFYPNGGTQQPGCENGMLKQEICSHHRSWQLFHDSIIDPASFPAIKCASFDDFMNQENGGDCNTHDLTYLGFLASPK